MSESVSGSNLTAIVLSSDKYRDLWPVFCHHFRAHWGNCPYRVFILANEESLEQDGITTLQTGRDISWSDSLIFGLKQIDSKFVLFLYEDTLPISPFRIDIIINALKFLEKVGGTCVKLRRGRYPLSPVPDEPAMGRLSTHLPYRNSLLYSIWDRLRLLTYLKPGESAWDFETKANSRTEADEEFYALRQDHFKFIHAVVKGRWTRRAANRVLKDVHGYTITRPVMSWWEDLRFRVYVFGQTLFIKILGVRIFRALHEFKWSTSGTYD